MKPIIGITTSIEEDKAVKIFGTYVTAIEQSGGIPLLIPYLKDRENLERIVDVCHGFLFTGGKDIDPSYYGEEKKDTCVITQPLRDEVELRLFESVYQSNKPILAICRGIQLVNVALGGTLYQDIPTDYQTNIRHRQEEHKDQPSHPILVEKGTPLYAMQKKDVMTGNSFHHQAIKTLGKGLAVMARAEDGIIESIFSTEDRYLCAYQWHPEKLYGYSDNKLLFDHFIKACK